MKKFCKKIIVSFLILSFFFSPILALPARAQWVVYDPANFAVNTTNAVNTTFGLTMKEGGLDGLAWIIVNLIIERIAASTVQWINSGFKGTPSFITNPERYFTTLGDNIAGQYIFANPNLNFLCGPIQAKIRLALTQNYLREPYWQCTLTDAYGNMEDFMGDFSKGGWDKFFELTQKPQNNPLGAFLQAENELNLRISTRKDTAQEEFKWGNGFMTFKTCKKWSPAGSLDQFGTMKLPEPPPDVPVDKSREQRTCLETETATPGSVIQSQLNKTLGLGSDKLAVADELNEIVSALLNQLVNQVVGGIGKGLRGLSEKDTKNQSFVDKLKDNTSISGYFCLDNTNDPTSKYYDTDPDVCKYPETPNTSAKDVPLPSPNPPPGAVPNPVYPTQCTVNPNLPQCQPVP